ncbi:ABC-type antimicrobial peptide transport system permease subunit [Pedobacter cryoconitis]|uniref:ABC-type antimicrobial peptide transport system permease subunit n=1 Tax=Pedobacter cryoconitis TaxID=188932 RepID=A0A7W8YXS0_9SPHI|nr:ABC transporter permease [Pedobacter cryoconitis]MBB5623761.1 ABC-type antimicrobial peptide transport system permease subunit [Pedobacter cryoconitis]
MFKLDLKIALRSLWKNKGYTLINIGGLAIGLASCMILLLYVAYEWSYDRQFTNFDKTYVIYNNAKTSSQTFSWAWTPNAMADEVRNKITGVTYASHSSYPREELISNGEKNFKKKSVYTDQSFLKIFDYKFLKGNPLTALANVNSVILTETMAKNLFGDEDPINKTVKLEGTEVLKVEGVIEDVPKNSTIQFDYLMPWSLLIKQNPWIKQMNWGNNMCLTVVQLRSNTFFDKANGQIRDIYKNNNKDATNAGLLHPLTKWHLYDTFENGKSVGGKIDQLRIFLILAFCILLIACVNFMNLSTAKSEKRAKEVGVRKAIGSSRRALIGQFMIESILLSFMAMLVAFTLMEVSLPYFNALLNIELTISYQNWTFWLVLFGLTSFTGFIAGSYPAFYLSSFEPVKVLKGFNTAGSSSLSVRKALVVFQFVFAACLIICTIVIYQQLNYIKDKSIGYEKAGLIEIPLQGNLFGKEKLMLLKERLLKTGAVTGVTFFSRSINEGGNNTFSVGWPGKNPKEDILFNNRDAGEDFAKTIGSDLVEGREFSSRFTADSTHIVINQAAVKVMGLKHPIGTTLNIFGKLFTIIGVMKDFVMESPYKTAAPMFITNHLQGVNHAIIRLNPTQSIGNSVAQIDEVIKALNPNFPVDRKFVDESFQQKFQDERLLGILSNWFGGFAIFISCLGLLGLALFMAEQRKKEISIRKILGASTLNILTLLNKDFIKLVAIANLIAFPLAYIIISKWLSAFEFNVGVTVLPFVIATGLSLIIAILTVSVQSVKVAKATPIDSLKHE